MKILLNKLKKANRFMLIIFAVIAIAYLFSYGFFTKSMLSLTGIETGVRIVLLILFILWFILYVVWCLVALVKNRKVAMSIISIISAVFIAVFLYSSYYIDKLYNILSHITQADTATYTSVLISLKDTSFSEASKIGMIEKEDDKEGYILANEIIKRENLSNEIKHYEEYHDIIADLYVGKIDAIFVADSYQVLFGSEEQYANITEDTKIIYTLSKDMKTEESKITSTKSLTEPFTILLLGVDSESTNGLNPNAPFNGDTIMLVTFNPKTLSATMFSIPRDMYVPIACNNNRYNKINSSAAYGTSCVINTVQNMTGISIDYFVKVNFRGVVDIVDTIGGIDVDVETPYYRYNSGHDCGLNIFCEQNSLRQFGSNMIYINPGMQHLNGEQALAYSRNRHQYGSDIERNRHQQQVIEAIAQQLMTNASLSDFESLLQVVTKNIATNMETKQMLSFYQSLKNMLQSSMQGNDFITIQKTHLEYYGLNVYLPAAGMKTSALGYYTGSMDAIRDAMLENLGQKEIQMDKTFSYDYNNDKEYSVDVIGKGIRTGARLETMRNFIGLSVGEAESYANSHGIKLTKEYTKEGNVAVGLIANQNVHEGTFLKNVSSLTIYIKEASPIHTPAPDPNPDPDPTTPSIPGGPSNGDNGSGDDPDGSTNIPGMP